MSDHSPGDFKRIRIEVPDDHGVLRGKIVPSAKIESPLGAAFCDAIFGLTVADDVFTSEHAGPHDGWPDVSVFPDLETLRPVRWEPAMAAVMADYRQANGDPHPLCQREAVRRAERRLADLGYTAEVALEFEIFVFKADPEAMAARRYRDLTPLSRIQQAYSFQRLPEMSAFVHDLFEGMDAYGAPIESLHTELGYGVIEVALKHAPPLEAADRAARFKLGIKEIAARHGLVPTFMAKWKEDEPGSSGHIHQSLWSGDTNAFFSAAGRVSDTLASYVEGLLSTAADLSIVYGPNLNSYRRPDPVNWAPTTASWGQDNRLTCVRVMTSHPNYCRAEMRRPGADLAIYLSIAGSLASGVSGIEEGLEIRPKSEGDPAQNPQATPLPSTYEEALDALRNSTTARDLLGKEMVDHYVVGREAEFAHTAAQRARVPDWELERYFEHT